MKSKSEFYPPFRDEGELIASWGEARLIKYLGGKVELKGGTKEDRLAAQEWMSLFWDEAVVEGNGHLRRSPSLHACNRRLTRPRPHLASAYEPWRTRTLRCPQSIHRANACPASGIEPRQPTLIGGNMNQQRMTRRSFLGTTVAAGGALCATKIFAPWAFGAGQDTTGPSCLALQAVPEHGANAVFAEGLHTRC